MLSSESSVLYCRKRTNKRIMSLFTSIALSDSNTLLSMATPNSVKANGAYLILAPRPLFKVANCDLEQRQG